MIDFGPHWVFIVSGYGGVTIVIAALIGWTVVASRRAKTRLATLERRS